MAKNIEVTLTLNDRGFSRKAANAQRQISGLGSASRASGGAVAGLAARFVAIAAPIVAATAAFRQFSAALNVSSEFEQTRVVLASIIGSAEGGEAAFQRLRKVAEDLPVAFSELSGAAPALATISKDINELEQNTRLAADLAATFGISYEDAASQLQRAFSAGAGAADIFREKGVLAAAGFQAGVSYSVDETIEKLREFGTEVEGASAKLNETFAGAVNQAGDAFEIFQESIGDVILPEAQAFLEQLIVVFRENKEEIIEFGKALGTNVIAGIKGFIRGVATAADIVASLGQTARRIGQAIRQNFGEQIRVVANVVVKAMGGIVEGVSLVGIAIGKLISATTGVDDVENFFTTVNEAANRVRREGLDAIEDVSAGIGDMIPVTTYRDAVDEFLNGQTEMADAIRETRDETRQAVTDTDNYTISLGSAGTALKQLSKDQEDLIKSVEGQVRSSAIEEIRKAFQEGAISASEFKELIGDLSDFMRVELALAKEALESGKPLSEIFGEDSIASVEFKTSLIELQDALEGTTLTSENYARIQELIKSNVDELGLSLEQQLFLLKLLDAEFMEQEGMLSFLDTLGQAQVALSTDLASALLEGESLLDGFKNFFKTLVNQIIADVIRLQIIQPILSSLFGLQFGAGGAVTGLDFGGSFFGGLFGKQHGGAVMKNRPYIVGERGPELFVPSSTGNIVPNHQMGQQTVNYNINAVDAMSFKQMVARDPEFIYSVTQAGRRRLPI